jgi:hypothetical protein
MVLEIGGVGAGMFSGRWVVAGVGVAILVFEKTKPGFLA